MLIDKLGFFHLTGATVSEAADGASLKITIPELQQATLLRYGIVMNVFLVYPQDGQPLNAVCLESSDPDFAPELLGYFGLFLPVKLTPGEVNTVLAAFAAMFEN